MIYVSDSTNKSTIATALYGRPTTFAFAQHTPILLRFSKSIGKLPNLTPELRGFALHRVTLLAYSFTPTRWEDVGTGAHAAHPVCIFIDICRKKTHPTHYFFQICMHCQAVHSTQSSHLDNSNPFGQRQPHRRISTPNLTERVLCSFNRAP